MATETVPLARPDISPVLIGRDVELDRLMEALGRAPSVILVEGEAGVGKSRLVREAMGQLDEGKRVLVGSCHPLPKPFPLGPVIEALQGPITSLPPSRLANPLLGALRPLFPEVADRLPAPPDALEEPGAERHRLFRAIAAVIDLLSPRVLLLEDVHWSDSATVELLTLLAPALEGERSILLTSRTEEVASPRALAGVMRPRPGAIRASIALRPLDRESTRDLTRCILGASEISQEFTDYLHERTGGVPFALEELLRLLDPASVAARKGAG